MAQAVATAIVVAVVVAAVLPAACDAVRPKKRSQMGKAERKAQQNLCHACRNVAIDLYRMQRHFPDDDPVIAVEKACESPMVRVTGEFMAKFEEPVQSGCVELIRDHREAVTNALIATGWHMNDHIELEQAICVHATNVCELHQVQHDNPTSSLFLD